MAKEYFKDKVIWLTGASSGIGEALAYQFSKMEARLILSSRKVHKLEKVLEQCEHPERHEILSVDLEDLESLPEKAKEAMSYFGRVDMLINNGGISQRSMALDTPFEVDQRIMTINYFAPVILTKEILPSMIERKQGHIVVTSSLTGKFGTPLRTGYSASKHALHGFYDALRAEVWREKIFIMLVCPGYIKTDISLNALTADGSPQGTMDKGQENGLSAEACARKIIKGMYDGKDEILVGGMETLGVYVKRFLPGYFKRMIRNVSVTG